MKSPEYLAINPIGKVPAIKLGSEVVTEAAAICAYLADAFPEKNLAPALSDRASYYRWLFFTAGPLETAVCIRTLGVAIPQEQEVMIGYGNHKNVQDVLDDWLKNREFVASNSFTAADVYVASHIRWGMQVGTLESRPVFVDYAQRMHARPAAQRAIAIDDSLTPEQYRIDSK